MRIISSSNQNATADPIISDDFSEPLDNWRSQLLLIREHLNATDFLDVWKSVSERTDLFAGMSVGEISHSCIGVTSGGAADPFVIFGSSEPLQKQQCCDGVNSCEDIDECKEKKAYQFPAAASQSLAAAVVSAASAFAAYIPFWPWLLCSILFNGIDCLKLKVAESMQDNLTILALSLEDKALKEGALMQDFPFYSFHFYSSLQSFYHSIPGVIFLIFSSNIWGVSYKLMSWQLVRNTAGIAGVGRWNRVYDH